MVIHTNISALRAHPEYAAAKAGDIAAAVNVVDALVKPERVKALAAKYPNAVVAFVHAEEATGRNKLPLAYAGRFEDSGLELSTNIVQSNIVRHTGASAIHRMLVVPEFDGPVEAGREYIIVDDVATSGSSLAALRAHIEANGGTVVAASTLGVSGNAQTGYGGYLAIKPETLSALRDKFDILALEGILRAYGIASGIQGLTNSQGKYVLGFTSAESLGNRIAAAGFDKRGSGNASPAGQAQTLTPEAVRSYLDSNGTRPEAAARESERVSRALAQHRPDRVGEFGTAYSQADLFGGDGTVENPEKLGRQVATHAAAAMSRAKARTGRDAVSQDLISGLQGNWEALAREVNSKGRASAILPDLIDRKIPAWTLVGTKIETPEDVHALMLPLRSPYFESLKVMVLDGNNNVVHAQILTVGSVAESTAHPADIFGVLARLRETTGKKHTNIIISHNHPSGDPSPSRADEQITRRLQNLADLTGWNVVDHVVTNGDKYYSFRESGLVGGADKAEKAYTPKNDTGKAPEKITKEQQQAPWEAVKMSNLRPMDSPDLVAVAAKSLRQGNPDAVHILYVNTRLRLVAVERVDKAVISNKRKLAQAVLAGRIREGAHGYILALHESATDTEKTFAARIAMEVSGMVAMSAIDVNGASDSGMRYYSAAEEGLVAEDPATLGSSSNESSAVQEALAKMPPIYRKVFEDIEAGDSPSVVMKRHNIPELGVTNILNQVRARIATATAAASGTLKPSMKDGKFDGGRPDLALSTNPTIAAVDQIRNESDIPDVRHWDEVNQKAADLLEKDYVGTYDMLLAKSRDMQPMTDMEVAASKMIIARELLGICFWG